MKTNNTKRINALRKSVAYVNTRMLIVVPVLVCLVMTAWVAMNTYDGLYRAIELRGNAIENAMLN